jgi:Bacterial PH domain
MADGLHRTYRPPALLGIGGIGAILAVFFAGWVAVDELGRHHWMVAVAAALWGLLIAALIVEVFLRPAVATTDQGIVLVNPFRTVVVPWSQVRGVETELALQILTDTGRHTSWAATGNRNAWVRGRRRRADHVLGAPWGASGGGSPSTAELLRTGGARAITPPVECKIFIDAGLQAWQGSREKPAGTGEPRAGWHRHWLLAVAAVAVALAAVTIAL